MDYIRKIPMLMGLGAGLLIGMIGYASKTPNRDNILNMLIGMAVFYTVGIFIRHTIQNIIEATLVKIVRKEEEAKKLEQEKKRELQRKTREDERRQASTLDLVADDSAEPKDEGFDALPVAEFIKKELK